MNSYKGAICFCYLTLTSLFFYSCSPASPKLIPAPVVSNEKITNTNKDVFLRPAVDVLFVVDDSGSMGVHQDNVAANMNEFVNEFAKLKLIKYHIGVTSSSIGTYTGSTAPNGKLSGKLGAIYVEPGTPNRVEVLKSNLGIGTGGSGTEMLFDPVVLATSPELTDIGMYNYGFYRPNGYFVVIFITDAEDQSSSYDAKKLMDYLVALKKGDRTKILSYGAIIPSSLNVMGSTTCVRDEAGYPADPPWYPETPAVKPVKIEEFLNLNVNKGRNVISLCDKDFGKKLIAFSNEIVGVVNKPIILSRPPIVSTIRVTYGTQVIPPDAKIGWSFDPKQNAILFTADLILDETQPADASIEVGFDEAHFPEEIP